MTLALLATSHCRSSRPALCLKGHIEENYGVTHRQFRNVATGRSKATDQFLQRVSATHARLFPGEPLDLPLPDRRTLHVDGSGKTSITFPKS